MKPISKLFISTTIGAVIAGVIGCSGTEFNAPPMNAPPPPPPCPPGVQVDCWSSKQYSRMANAGKELFDNNCTKCHTDNGVSNAPGPDLSDYGSEGWTHRRAASFIGNAQLYMPGTKMPVFCDKLSQKQIDQLAAYLTSLKKQAYYLQPDAPMLPPGEEVADQTSETILEIPASTEQTSAPAATTP